MLVYLIFSVIHIDALHLEISERSPPLRHAGQSSDLNVVPPKYSFLSGMNEAVSRGDRPQTALSMKGTNPVLISSTNSIYPNVKQNLEIDLGIPAKH